MRVADLGAEAVRGLVTSAGVIDRNPARMRQTGAQYITGLVEEAVMIGDQQAHELAFGDDDAKRLQQR